MIEIAENRVIHNLCKNIFEQIYLKYRPEYMREERLKEATQEHWAIIEALKERDVKKVRRLLKQHVKTGREHIVGSLWQEEDTALDF